jgi:outer membrane protein assembly factor BamA
MLCSLFFLFQLKAQQGSEKKIQLIIDIIDKDSSFHFEELKLQTSFNSKSDALYYINKLPSLLAEKGYPAASVDSFITADLNFRALIYLGIKINRVELNTKGIEADFSDDIPLQKMVQNKKFVDLAQLENLKQKIISYYEDKGYPFTSVYLDSIRFSEDIMMANLKIEKESIYYIDSIRVLGKANISRQFLEKYLGIPKHSVYNKSKLIQVDKRMLELPFLSSRQPSDLTMLGSGALLNLYLQPKKSSQFNFLVGFLPTASNTGKVQLTGDVNLDLRNMLGGGERFLLKWQQLQPQSPRLNLGYNKPYIFNTSFGFDGLFDLFKKDSNFLQLNARVGLQYVGSGIRSGKIFVQWQNTTLLSGGVDTLQIKAKRSLPPNIDVSAVNMGIEYSLNTTDYRLNPRSGSELTINTAVGIKTIKKNNDIVNIKDPAFDFKSLYDSLKLKNFQFRLRVNAAHYFPVGKSATIKTAIQAGLYKSPFVFRNELFQIGGYNLLRGFDEEGIFATQFGVLTTEYRFLLALNSYLSFFMDAGLTKNKYQQVNANNRFLGGGVGFVYETKSGLLNFSIAVGSRNDLGFDIRRATKIHFGYINYF